jgi:hypothetical protein
MKIIAQVVPQKAVVEVSMKLIGEVSCGDVWMAEPTH